MTDFDAQAYWEERHSKNLGPETVGYAGLGVPYNEWMYKIRRAVTTEKIRAAGINVAKSSILDIGSGTGFYLELWNELGAGKVMGSDISKFAVEALNKKFPQSEICLLNISEEIPEKLRGRFQIVSVFDVFYHIVDDELYARAFNNIRALLVDRGYFIFTENCMKSQSEVGRHQSSRTEVEIRAHLNRNGFEVLLRAPVFYLMNRPVRYSNPLLHLVWFIVWAVTHRFRRYPSICNLFGAAMYLLERACLRVVSDGPSTILMICRSTQRPSGQNRQERSAMG